MVPIPDEIKGQRPVAFVICKDSSAIDDGQEYDALLRRLNTSVAGMARSHWGGAQLRGQMQGARGLRRGEIRVEACFR